MKGIRIILRLIIVSFLIGGTPLNTSIKANSTITIELIPTDDAYVDSDEPFSNYGTFGSLRVDNWGYGASRSNIYLKIDLTFIPLNSTIKKAILRLYCYYLSFTSSIIDIHPCSDTFWSETTITYNNAPFPTKTILDSECIFWDDEWYSWNITEYVQEHIGEKITVVLLTSTNYGYVAFWSKEWLNEAGHPRLFIEYSLPNQPPIANFYYMPESPIKVGTILKFKDSSTDIDDYIVNWTWDFGDGTIAYGQNVSHAYSKSGIYNVTLTVTDAHQNADSYTLQIIVEEEKGIPSFEFAFLAIAIASLIILNGKKRNE